jgi:hypothetical protein
MYVEKVRIKKNGSASTITYNSGTTPEHNELCNSR